MIYAWWDEEDQQLLREATYDYSPELEDLDPEAREERVNSD